MKRLRILSVADTRYVVDAYVETARAAEALGFEVVHLGVANDLWYGQGAGSAYADGSCGVLLSPRPSASPTPWWHTPDIASEAAVSLPAITQFYRELIRDFRPDVFLIADDQGALEVATIHTMNASHVPVLLLEHGFGFALGPRQSRPPRLTRAKAAVRKLRAAALARLKSKHDLAPGGRRSPRLPTVKPFGRNGVCTICAYSGFTAHELARQGVPRRAIRHTGFPYYDQVVRLRDSIQLRHPASRAVRERLLLVSSGSTRFSWSAAALQAWHRDLEIARIAAASFAVTLRLHPGETPEELPDDVRSGLLASSVSIDTAKEPARVVLPSYDIVVGGASTVHQEATILGVPSVVVAQPGQLPPSHEISGAELLEAGLGMLVLRAGDDVSATLEAARRPEYRQGLLGAQRRTGRLIYDNDGQAGRRVAETILLQCGLT